MARIGWYVIHSDGRKVEHHREPKDAGTDRGFPCGASSFGVMRGPVRREVEWCGGRCRWLYYFSLFRFDRSRFSKGS